MHKELTTELATQILLSSIRKIGISSVGRNDLNQQLSAIGVSVPKRIEELKVFCSSANLIKTHLEPVVRERMSEASNVEVDDEVVREALAGVQLQLSHELHFSVSNSLLDVRNRIAVILANSLPGEPTKPPRI